jgi:hypothetical protein
VGKQRGEFVLLLSFSVVSELWGWGFFAHFLSGIFGTGLERVLWRAWRGPRACESWSPTADAARPPRVVSCSDLVLPLRQEILLCCSGTAVRGLARRWPSQCNGVCSHFVSISALVLTEDSISACVCWWACAAEVPSTLWPWCIGGV